MAHACADVVEEIPVQAPWSFGPIPPGDVHAPSYAESVTVGVEWAVDWLLAHPCRTFLLGGYSQGGECAARIHAETLPGGRLAHLRANYVGGFAFGCPSRQDGHVFYAGPVRRGEGIAQYRQTGMGDDWADEVDAGDMYGAVPTNLTGEIMRDVYSLCTDLQIHDWREFARDLAANCLAVLGNLDGDAYDDVMVQVERMGLPTGWFAGANIAPPDRIEAVREKYLSVAGIAAATAAAIRAITFFAQGTAPHIQYHLREVFPGQTYVAHAAQHVRHWAGTRQPMH